MPSKEQREIDVTKQRVVKFMPHNPPTRGDYVLVDGERCRVRRVEVTWDGLIWTLHKLIVEADHAK